jgi:hypothetical protein
LVWKYAIWQPWVKAQMFADEWTHWRIDAMTQWRNDAMTHWRNDALTQPSFYDSLHFPKNMKPNRHRHHKIGLKLKALAEWSYPFFLRIFYNWYVNCHTCTYADVISVWLTQFQIWDLCYDFLNIFAKKISTKLAFLSKNKAKICKIVIITLVFEKNANFFAENWQKSQKIVIITSTPGKVSHEYVREESFLDMIHLPMYVGKCFYI